MTEADYKEKLYKIEVAILGFIEEHKKNAEFWHNRDARIEEFHKGRIFELRKVLKIVQE